MKGSYSLVKVAINIKGSFSLTKIAIHLLRLTKNLSDNHTKAIIQTDLSTDFDSVDHYTLNNKLYD